MKEKTKNELLEAIVFFTPILGEIKTIRKIKGQLNNPIGSYYDEEFGPLDDFVRDEVIRYGVLGIIGLSSYGIYNIKNLIN